MHSFPHRLNTMYRALLRGGACPMILGLFVLGTACDRSVAGELQPRPPAGRAPVTVGELVQLRLAVEGFETVFDARAAEQDLLPHLVHAWATFYHWPDPPADTAARYRFTEDLCRARLPGDGPGRDLHLCMEALREALLDDLVRMTKAYRRQGRPDRVGEHRLSELERDFNHRLAAHRALRQHKRSRRLELVLPVAARCNIEHPRVPVVAVSETSLLVNGYPVLSAPRGLGSLPLADYELFSSHLESRLLEAPRDGNNDAQLVVAAHRQLDLQVVQQVFTKAAHEGVTRVCLKVTRQGPFRVPCCLPLRLGPPGVDPSRVIELGPTGLVLVDGSIRTPIGPTDTIGGERSIRLVHGATISDLAGLIERATSALEVLVGGTTPKAGT